MLSRLQLLAAFPIRTVRVIFDCRSYNDRAASSRHYDLIFLNVTGATSVIYDVAVSIDNKLVFTEASVTHYWLTRWRKVFSIGL